ncbi:MAG: Lrp/AsnC family transcriptional regulator [Actinomycetota bacterium]
MDPTDRRIVQALREQGRLPFAELGRQVGLSGPAVQERVRRLEERGVITGFTAVVDAAAVGLGVSALIGITVADGAETDDVARRLKDVDEIEDCWFVAGEENFVVTVRARDVASLEAVVTKLRRLRGVARTRTTVVLSTRWEGRPAPLPDPA